MAVIEKTLKIGGILKATKRKLAIGKDKMYALRDEQGNITHSFGEIIKLAERLYTRCYASDVNSGLTTERKSSTCDVPTVTKDEVGKSMKGMKIARAAGADGITVDIMKEIGNILLESLAAL